MDKYGFTFIGCDAAYGEAGTVMFGAPFDSTTSFRPGTRFAASAMRPDSSGLETYSPYQDRDLEDIRVHDGGDLLLPLGDTPAALVMLEQYTDGILADGKLPCMIGGEHLVTLGAVRAAFKRYPDLHILHFDAHTDLREQLLGVTLSHATVMRRIWELVGDGHIYQFGIRSGERAEFEWIREGHVTTCLHGFDTLPQAVRELRGKPVYFSLDLDVLDPSVFPGTGTPEAGGVSFRELLDAMLSLSELDVVAMDINELSPPYDHSGVSTAVACKLLREMLLLFGK